MMVLHGNPALCYNLNDYIVLNYILCIISILNNGSEYLRVQNGYSYVYIINTG